ncbi:MAG: hypothetical protein C0408_07185 [Odoribacter sp.]|nr:hypothetical protein [Odoribacter sp.]
MNRFSIRHLVVFTLVFTVVTSVCDAQATGGKGRNNQGKGIFGIFSGKKSGSKIKAPKKMSKVIKEQEKKDKKLKEDYAKSIVESQKRTIKIQTPDVQERMKQNKKDIEARDKAKKKKSSLSGRKTGKKYKK